MHPAQRALVAHLHDLTRLGLTLGASLRLVDPLLAELLHLSPLELVALALLEVRAVEDRRAQVAEFNYRDAGSIYGIYSEMAPMQ